MNDDLYERNEIESRRDERFNNWLAAICAVGTIVMFVFAIWPGWKELMP